jgi:uncharacterized protein (DUF433 family)
VVRRHEEAAEECVTGAPRISGPIDTLQVGSVEGRSVVMKSTTVSRSVDVMGGTAVFYGTRVPVQTLLDYLEAGESIDDFLEGFPSVTRDHVVAFLEEAKDRVIEAAS